MMLTLRKCDANWENWESVLSIVKDHCPIVSEVPEEISKHQSKFMHHDFKRELEDVENLWGVTIQLLWGSNRSFKWCEISEEVSW